MTVFRLAALGLGTAALLAACGGRRPASAEVAAPAPTDVRDRDWHRIATQADRERLRNARVTWLAALAEARAADAAAIAAEPALFAIDRALPRPIPPTGDYRCRTFKLGSQGQGGLGFIAYPWFACTIADADGLPRFRKVTGSQRPVGAIYGDGAARAIFLGTILLGDEARPLSYGRDAQRDMVGVVERIGERRWRIAYPEPRFESKLDVIELVPAG